MIIDCISDLHGATPELEGGDLLLIAGDLTRTDKAYQYDDFVVWLKRQNYACKIVVAGNHDGLLEHGKQYLVHHPKDNIHYLQDTGFSYEGLSIWGSPWTPTFCDWSFMADRGDPIAKKWALIPQKIDIVVTHGPMAQILDKNVDGDNVGCWDLRDRIDSIMPKMHVCGHIHEARGYMLLKHAGPNTLCVNASIMDEHYRAAHKRIRVLYDKESGLMSVEE